MAFRKTVAFLACFFVSFPCVGATSPSYIYIQSPITTGITEANANPDRYPIVYFRLVEQSVTLTSSPADLADAITQSGLYISSMGPGILDGASAYNLLRKNNDLDIWVQGESPAAPLTLQNFRSASTGSALSVGGNLVLDAKALIFNANQSTGDGSAVFSGGIMNIGRGSWNQYAYPVSFLGNHSGNNGGAIAANGGLTTSPSPDLSFTSNRATGRGGAIAVGGITNLVGKATFTTNMATDGGAIFSSGDFYSSDTSNTTFTGNIATNTGGAIYCPQVTNLRGIAFFTENSANRGGAIFGGGAADGAGNPDRAINLYGTTIFERNTARTEAGGAIHGPGPINFLGTSDSTFTENNAATGGAIYGGQQISLSGKTTFTGNTSSSTGGAIHATGPITLDGTSDATFSSNVAANSGGAIYAGGAVNLNGKADFTGNRATSTTGGAIYTNSNVTLSGPTTFTGNVADYGGGAIYAGGDVNISGPTSFTRSTVDYRGGAIYAGGDVSLTDTQFDGNSAASQVGGAIYMAGSNKTLTYTTTQKTVLNPAGTMLGDNDIAGGSSVGFVKAGPADLVLNTKNPGWMGPTTVNAGRMIVGDSAHTDASWGSIGTSDGVHFIGTPNITVQSGATLGGFGTVCAIDIAFESGSTWVAGITPGGQSGQLVSNTLTLDPTTKLQIIPSSGTYSKDPTTYTIATYQLFTKLVT